MLHVTLPKHWLQSKGSKIKVKVLSGNVGESAHRPGVCQNCAQKACDLPNGTDAGANKCCRDHLNSQRRKGMFPQQKGITCLEGEKGRYVGTTGALKKKCFRVLVS